MTAKSIFAVGLVGLVFISLALLNSRKDSQTTPRTANEFVPQNLSSVPPSNSNSKPLVAISKQNHDPKNAPAPTQAIKTAPAEERITELENLGTHNDPQAFQAIVTELSNSSAEVRKAARDAIKQFANRDAIPILKDLAATTTDAREKVELLDAVEFLSLPSLSELRQKQRTNSAQAQPTISK